MLHAIIMAGGSGTRFWPASRRDTPKQMLSLVGDETMIRQTAQRLGDVVPPERRMVVTNQRLAAEVAKQLPELPAASIVGEPCKRDTAPCIGLAALLVTQARKDPDGVMIVMPADHVIAPPEVFQAAVKQAEALVNADPSRIVTFGIKPTYPAEIFGYIHRGQPRLQLANAPLQWRVGRKRHRQSLAGQTFGACNCLAGRPRKWAKCLPRNVSVGPTGRGQTGRF